MVRKGLIWYLPFRVVQGILYLGWFGLLMACQPSLPPPLSETPPTAIPTLTDTQPSPLPTPSPAPHISTPIRTPTLCPEGKVELYTLDSTPIGKPLRFRIYFPPCYNPQAESKYPVLYLLHGQGSDETLWMDLGLPQLADRLMSEGQIPPFLIVMPYEEYALRDPRESVFGQTIVENLIPWVESHFAVCPARECRALGGISRGGGWALHLFIQYPNLFIAVGVHSPAPFWGDDLRLYYRTAENPPEQWPNLYLDSGERDRYLKPAQAFVNRLGELGIPHEWHLNSGEHNSAYWQNHLEDYLRWYAAQWRIPAP